MSYTRFAAVYSSGVISGVVSRARRIFLRDLLPLLVVEVLTACASVSRDDIKGASSLGPKEDTPLISSRETEAQAVKTSTTLGSESLRKILREKLRVRKNRK